jgi:dienelactone hydrolase
MSAVRERLLGLLGVLPERPHPVVTTREPQFAWQGVFFEKWSVRGPREDIPAYFLRPEARTEPLPTLLALHPHGRQFELGKSAVAGLVADPHAYGMAAAKAGFAVLAPDLPAFEERRPPLEARKKNYALQGEVYERSLAMHALARGSTLQASILADLATCVDALVEDPRVDRGQVGVIGHSYGGQEALLAMLFDERLRGGIVSCGFSLVSLLVERFIAHNPALYLPGMLPDCDFDALVPALVPRALCVIAAEQDAIFPVEGVRTVEAATAAAYDAASVGAKLRFRYVHGPHSVADREIAEALAWLRPMLAARSD